MIGNAQHDNMPDIVHVTQSSQLQPALESLAAGEHVAVDTEFLRESTYYPKLCLVQVGNAHACVVVDVLTIDNVPLLLSFLAERTRLKILHAARQDLEVLCQAQQGDPIVPGPLFDTQIAAALLGFPAQIGYGDLLNRCLQVDLPKGLARTDWSRRPLSEEQLKYAADDVRYLGPLHERLAAGLQRAGRSQWLEEEMRLMDNIELHRTLPEESWQRLRGTAQLEPAQRAALKKLCAWRETRAMQSDKPRGWILSDDAVRSISERLPETLQTLEHCRDLQPAVLRKHAEYLLELVQEAKRDAVNEAPAKDFRPSNQQQSEVSRMMKLVRATAETLTIAPEILVTRRDAERWIYFGNADGVMQGWRREVIGEVLLKQFPLEK